MGIGAPMKERPERPKFVGADGRYVKREIDVPRRD
jgi:hypothetical protein